jgi:hypothetical protein
MFIKFWGPLEEKEYKIRYESEYLFITREKITTLKS